MRHVVLAVALAMTLALAGCSGGTSVEGGASEVASQISSGQKPSAQDAAPASQDSKGKASQTDTSSTGQKTVEQRTLAMRLSIDGADVAVDWEDNESVAALTELTADGPLTVQMSMYGGFEQVGPLGATLPSDDVQTTTQAGDIVLYSGDQIVVFYGSNSWAYTRLGHIADRTDDELAALLGNDGIVLTITAD